MVVSPMEGKHIYVYYQSSCAFCVVCRKFIQKRIKNTGFTFLDLAQYRENEGHEALHNSIIVKYKDEQYFKYHACIVIAQNLSKPWPFISKVLRFVPTSLGDWGYDFIANHRGFMMHLHNFFSLRK